MTKVTFVSSAVASLLHWMQLQNVVVVVVWSTHTDEMGYNLESSLPAMSNTFTQRNNAYSYSLIWYRVTFCLTWIHRVFQSASTYSAGDWTWVERTVLCVCEYVNLAYRWPTTSVVYNHCRTTSHSLPRWLEGHRSVSLPRATGHQTTQVIVENTTDNQSARALKVSHKFATTTHAHWYLSSSSLPHYQRVLLVLLTTNAAWRCLNRKSTMTTTSPAHVC